MSDSKAYRAAAAAPAARRDGDPESWKGFGSRWNERSGKAPPPPAAGAHRHSAITRGLSSYANYKTWADKVRTSWEEEDDKDGKDG